MGAWVRGCVDMSGIFVVCFECFFFFLFCQREEEKKREKLRPPFQVLISREYQILPDLGFMKAYLCTSCIIALAREREIRE